MRTLSSALLVEITFSRRATASSGFLLAEIQPGECQLVVDRFGSGLAQPFKFDARGICPFLRADEADQFHCRGNIRRLCLGQFPQLLLSLVGTLLPGQKGHQGLPERPPVGVGGDELLQGCLDLGIVLLLLGDVQLEQQQGQVVLCRRQTTVDVQQGLGKVLVGQRVCCKHGMGIRVVGILCEGPFGIAARAFAIIEPQQRCCPGSQDSRIVGLEFVRLVDAFESFLQVAADEQQPSQPERCLEMIGIEFQYLGQRVGDAAPVLLFLENPGQSEPGFCQLFVELDGVAKFQGRGCIVARRQQLLSAFEVNLCLFFRAGTRRQCQRNWQCE